MFFDFHHHFRGRECGIYNLDFMEEIPENYFSVGLHPNKIDENYRQNLDKIKEISQHPNCLAIGECGLDGLVSVDESLQEQIFEQQILWANEIQKPIIVHCVRRFSQLLRFQKITKVPLIVHGFNKKKETAEELVGKGFYLSFGEALLYNLSLQETAWDIPLDRIFLETDTAEEPIDEVYLKLAEIKEIPIEVLKTEIYKNVQQVLKCEI